MNYKEQAPARGLFYLKFLRMLSIQELKWRHSSLILESPVVFDTTLQFATLAQLGNKASRCFEGAV